MNQLTYRDYLVESRLPTIWCPGCGNGIVLKAILKAFADLGLDRKKTVAVSGIGCWGWADDYIDTNAFHGTHGRALAFATGIKLANPELTVVVLMGDGDGATIGGNHLIHAARRNVDLTAVVVNNFNYGMTGGQYSGTTPREASPPRPSLVTWKTASTSAPWPPPQERLSLHGAPSPTGRT